MNFGQLEVSKPDRERGTVLVGIDLKQAEGFSVAEVCAGSPDEISLTLAYAKLFAAAPACLGALQAVVAWDEMTCRDDWLTVIGKVRQALAQVNAK